MIKSCAEIWDEVRRKKPLIHCNTNYVTVNDVANIILAAGASPAMCEHPDEAGNFTALAQALYFNLGTLTTEKEISMLASASTAAANKIPLVIDPVACGVIPRKADVFRKIQALDAISIVKGNAAEIKSLAGLEGQARGVDSVDSGEGMEAACRQLSSKEGVVVAATGKIDVAAQGDRGALIYNGTELFQDITGAGCMAGGVMAACIGTVPEESWLVSITALCAFNIAGERAAKIAGNNPGTFRMLLFDQLYNLRGEDIIKEGRVEW